MDPRFSFLNPKNSYPTQLLEYTVGTDYTKHVDCDYTLNPKDRAFTVLLYLDDPSTKKGGSDEDNQRGNKGGSGGETIFPRK